MLFTAGSKVTAAEAASARRGLIHLRVVLVWHVQPLRQPLQQLKERLGAWRANRTDAWIEEKIPQPFRQPSLAEET